MTFEDKSLLCRDCENAFLFTVSEQAFYAARGLLNEPQRCPPCRALRRRQRNGKHYPVQHPIVCAACGAEDSVPFVPRYSRPIYCSSCYARIQPAQPNG